VADLDIFQKVVHKRSGLSQAV